MSYEGKSRVVTLEVALQVHFAYCALCDNKIPDDLYERARRGCRSRDAARDQLAMHRRERHIADWHPDDPRCELCSGTGQLWESDVPWPLPDRWWHTACHTKYLADPELEDEVDNRYEDRIKEEREWAAAVCLLVNLTEEERVLWSDSWKRISPKY